MAGACSLLFLILPSFNYLCVLPDAARVVFRACDDRVSFVVERAGEDLVVVAIQHLQLVSRICRPHAASLVATCSNDLVSLRIELYSTDFIFVSLQKRDEHIINARTAVRACSRQFVARAIETCVQHFVIVTSKYFDALASSDIP